jgi:hypothetical protein
MANSFDQNFFKNGNYADKISQVRIISASLQSADPSDYNIGNISSLKIYMGKSDGSDEVLVAAKKDIGENAGNRITLDIDNSSFLDRLVRQPEIRVRMVYTLRRSVSKDANLYVALGLAAYPNK